MKTCLILCGGRSDEHEISLISAKCILDALDRKQFKPLVVGISRAGKWYLEEETSFYVGECRADKIKLNEKAPPVLFLPFMEGKKGLLVSEGTRHEFDVVFPILHGPFGEDGTLQGLLDIVGVPYVGSKCGSSWVCMDKVVTKTLCEREKIAIAPFVVLPNRQSVAEKQTEIDKLGFPLFVKPARMGSSVGISRVQKKEELNAAVELAFKYDTKCLVEKGLSGREIECAVLGQHGKAAASVPGEVVPNKKIGWYSYDAKYLLKDGADVIIPAALDKGLTKQIQDFSLKAYDLLECEGMARVDMFYDPTTKTIYLNEINTIPGFTPISMYPKMWAASGISYPNLITRLLELAFLR